MTNRTLMTIEHRYRFLCIVQQKPVSFMGNSCLISQFNNNLSQTETELHGIGRVPG